ncbi:hypothetical protein K501DRAFT_280208 [Backusella circina FSU 941]|nr:hypothetical protein K501DRAFT_280208 [Backusella circina FSU 941]
MPTFTIKSIGSFIVIVASKQLDKNRLCSSSSFVDLVGSPSSLTSLSSTEFTAGGTLEPHIPTKIHRASTFTSSNQYFTDESDIHSRKKLIGKLTKMQQFFDRYQNSLATLEIEVADKQQEINRLLKIKSESEESLKEHIWDLELKNQELQQQMNQIQSCSIKSFAEQTRLERENEMLGQDLENLKVIQQTNETKMRRIQKDHDHEVLQLKRALTHLKQEKNTFTKQLEEDHAEQANLFQQVNPRDHQLAIIEHDSKDVKSSEVELDTLRASLKDSHIMIESLQKQIQYGASEKREVDQLLREAQETIENFQNSSSALHSPQWTDYHQTQQGELRSPRDNDDNSPSDNQNCRHYLGQSLEDEMYQFFNSSNLEKDNEDGDHKERLGIQDQSDTDKPVCEPQTDSQNTEQEEFGSLIKEPESFIYKPIRNHKTPTISENNTVEPISFQTMGTEKFQLTTIAVTMAGSWIWKYKRMAFSNRISINKHRRFIWIHPYSRTLYWSQVEPGSKGTEYKTKSDHDQAVIPSILIKTTLRGIQIQCLSMNDHTIWIKPMQFLVIPPPKKKKSLGYLLTKGGPKIDRASSEWLDNIIRPALGKRGLDTRVRQLLDTPIQSMNHLTTTKQEYL